MFENYKLLKTLKASKVVSDFFFTFNAKEMSLRDGQHVHLQNRRQNEGSFWRNVLWKQKHIRASSVTLIIYNAHSCCNDTTWHIYIHNDTELFQDFRFFCTVCFALCSLYCCSSRMCLAHREKSWHSQHGSTVRCASRGHSSWLVL